MQRRPSTQDLTWLLDLHRNEQLDLDPPYQRRSVWTRKDKQFFLDTIFRNYPSPAIFLHKTIDDAGRATYHVVDGKQRTQTILEFVEDRIKIANDYGDLRLDGKKWSELRGDRELKQKFWNYQVTVEMIDILDGSIVNEVFDRLNRNARKLTRQELRHAKFDGWLIHEAEDESLREEWKALGVVTTARAKRMSDVQFLSELMLVLLEEKIMGFDQDALDGLYAKYDEPSDTAQDLDPEEFRHRFASMRNYILEMNSCNDAISKYARTFGNFYSLWAMLVLADEDSLPEAESLALRYRVFMRKVDKLSDLDDLEAFLREDATGEYTAPFAYLTNSRGASTDLTQRRERLNALRTAILESANESFGVD